MSDLEEEEEFDPTVLIEEEGADLGALNLAGVKRECETCGGDSWTGRICTACLVAGAPEKALRVREGGYGPPERWRPAERAPNGCPVCAVTKYKTSCKFTGHVPPEPPETMCMPYCGHAAPAPVVELNDRAAGFGWTTEVRHSRGQRSGARTAADLWSVRFRRGTWQGYAVRVGDAWKSVCVAGAWLPPFLAIGVTQLKEWLAEPERCSAPEWVEAARRRAAAAQLHKKLVRCPGAPECVPIGPYEGPWPVLTAPVSPEHTHRASGAVVIKAGRKEVVAGA